MSEDIDDPKYYERSEIKFCLLNDPLLLQEENRERQLKIAEEQTNPGYYIELDFKNIKSVSYIMFDYHSSTYG